MKTYPSLTVFGLVAALVVAEGCGGSDGGPTAPSGPPTGPTFTISGVITEYHGGPLTGAGVVWLQCNFNWGIPCETRTDQQGHYSLSSPSGIADIGVWKEGYQGAWKTKLSAQNPSADFVLHQSVTLSPYGGTLGGTIQGDEFMAGDDIPFGGLCAHTACKVIQFGEFSGATIQVEVHLRWNDSTRQLALYRSVWNGEGFPNVQSAERYCCSSELVATLSVSSYFDAGLAVAFEQAGGGPPGPTDRQSFELRARALQ